MSRTIDKSHGFEKYSCFHQPEYKDFIEENPYKVITLIIEINWPQTKGPAPTKLKSKTQKDAADCK